MGGVTARVQVVVVGAGFGGLAVARDLAGAAVDVTIVDRNNFHTFQPLLYRVATAGLSGVDVCHAVRAMVHRQAHVRFRRATVVGVDWDGRQVDLADGGRLRFDYLVLGLGESTEYFGIEGPRSTHCRCTASPTPCGCATTSSSASSMSSPTAPRSPTAPSPSSWWVAARTDDPTVFVVGDLAAASSADGRLLPQLAPVAMQEVRHVARQIRRRLDCRETTRFRYRSKGLMTTIGRGSGVGELPLGVRLHGTRGWLVWLVLHLVMLAGFRNRISVFVSWAWNYITWDRVYRLIIELSETEPLRSASDDT